MTESEFPSFLKDYLSKIDSRILNSFYDYELLIEK